MYIDYKMRRPNIRECGRLDTLQAKNVNMKKLKMLDKQAFNDYHNARFHNKKIGIVGGSIGSWLKKRFKKVKNFATTAFNKVIKPAYQKVLKPAINFLAENPVGKAITGTAANVIGSAVSAIPGVGPVAGPVVSKVLPEVVNSTKSLTDAAEKVVQSIKEKNPQLTVQQAKEVVNTIKKTYDSLNDEVKKQKEEQQKMIMDKLPDTIKAAGFESVMKAAPFLPIVDLTTLKEETGETKGGKIKISYKIRKPKDADKYGKYSAPITARVAGIMFSSDSNVGGRRDLGGSCSKEIKEEPVKKIGGRRNLNGASTGASSLQLLEQLRNKYK